jgi:4-amino-4-deoxy-L-arabinose transferase-like glycosyltransferase
MRLINQHSYVLVGLAMLTAAWFGLRRLGSPLRWIALATVLVVVVAAAAWLRTGGGDVQTPTDLDRVLGHGQPVALEFYSNF